MRFLVSALFVAASMAQTVEVKCFGVPAGEQFDTIRNVVSAAVIGTNAGKLLESINNTEVNNYLFPKGFGWTTGVPVTGIVYDSLNAAFFNGVRLNSSYDQVFTYSPMIDSACNTTRNYDYTNGFLNGLTGMTNETAPNLKCLYPDADLTDHLIAMIGTYSSCSDFNQTVSGGDTPAQPAGQFRVKGQAGGDYIYDINYLNNYQGGYVFNNSFGDQTDVLAITAQYHRAMGFNAAVLDAFNAQVILALRAHGVSASAYEPLVVLLKTVFYQGQYSLISATNTDCGAGWRFVNQTVTVGNETTRVEGCVPNAASLASAFVAGVLALFALLF